jgi:hypothetical protein
LNPLAVTAGRLDSGASSATLGLPACLLGQPGGLEGRQNTVCVTAAALRAPEMYSVTAVAGGQAEHSRGLGLGGGGEGGVAHHHQSGVVVGGGCQLLQCGVVDMGQA